MILIRSFLIRSRSYPWHRYVNSLLQIGDCVSDFEIGAFALQEIWPF
jgi:hypothetical protein